MVPQPDREAAPGGTAVYQDGDAMHGSNASSQRGLALPDAVKRAHINPAACQHQDQKLYEIMCPQIGIL